MKKVVSIVLNNFQNDSRVLKENKSLQNAGYKVQIVALHDGILEEFEKVEGIDVHRVKLITMTWSKNIVISFLKYIEWSSRIIKKYNYVDIVHCNDLNTLFIGVVIKKLYNKKVKIVYDAHEYETEVNGLDGIQKTLTQMLEKFLIKYADKMITVSNAIADEYVKLYNIPKPALVLNTPAYKIIEKKDIFRETFDIKKEQTIFLYQGGLSRGRGIEILLDTFKLLDSKSVIVFMGYGGLEDEIKKAEKEHSNIYFHKAVSPSVLLNYTSSADFGILFYENSCLNHYYCSPNKMFEYLMAELPVIVSSLYEMKRLVEDNSVGVVANENTPTGLKVAIEKAVKLDKKELSQNIKQVKDIYNWKEQEKVLLKVYAQLAF